MKPLVTTALEIVGSGLIVAGVAMLAIWAALVTGGLLLLLISYSLARK